MPEKKKITIKKTTLKKPVKKPAIKKASKKPVKKTAKKVVAKKTFIKRKKSTTVTSQKKVRNEVSKLAKTELSDVKLPSNASLRAKSKARAISENLSDYIALSVYRVAIVSAACFLLVGSTLSLSNLFSVNDGLILNSKLSGGNSAQIISGGLLKTDIVTPELKIKPIVFDLLTNIPSVITEDTNLTFVATEANEIEVRLYKSGRNEYKKLSSTNLLNNKYRSEIIVDDLASGFYKIEFRLNSSNPENSLVKYSKEFAVESKEVAERVDQVKDIVSIDKSSSSTSELKESSLADNLDEKDNETLIINDIEESKPILEQENKTDFRVSILNQENSYIDLKVFYLGKPSFIEVYARPTNSLQEQFVTLANNRSDYWFASINTKYLPNGQYEIFAKAKVDQELISSEGKLVDVKNPIVAEKIPAGDLVTITKSEGDVEKIDSLTQPDSKSPEETINKLALREFASTTLTTDNGLVKTEARNEMENILQKNSDELNELLKLYAVAVQSEDKILTREASANLQNFKGSLLNEVIERADLKLLVDNIDTELTAEFSSLQNKISIFESLRKERTKGETTVDTDGDGIADFDEINLYKTDPNSPDTDQDGINDGIEIMSRFNPTDATREVIVTLVSPKETTGLVREDVLQVNSVSPILPVSDNETRQPVKAEIRGKALPNSFVTLYIFSNPIVVTIKTDVDGSFVYTLDKELDDGEHEVFVAVTDNTGSIIAQSNPFSFIKEASAFNSPNDVSEVVNVPVSSFQSNGSNINLVIGMSIISFGLILLMLGASIRVKKEEEDPVTIQDVDKTA